VAENEYWFACLWSIWIATSAKMFQNKSISVAKTLDEAKLLSWNWPRVKVRSFNYMLGCHQSKHWCLSLKCGCWHMEFFILVLSVLVIPVEPSGCYLKVLGYFVSRLKSFGISVCLSSTKTECLIQTWVNILIMAVFN
jgi:hypothetical protein